MVETLKVLGLVGYTISIMKTTNIVIAIVIIALIVIAFFAFKKPAVAPAPATQDTTSQATTKFTGIDVEGNTVIGDGPISVPIAQAQVARISIKNFAYVDATDGKPVVGTFDSKYGEEIIWTNNDSMAHTVTFDNGMADSGSIAPGKSFAFFFTKSGTYTYHCAIHPNMKGSLSFK